MKTILIHIGDTPRLFNVDDAMDAEGVQEAFRQMQEELCGQGRLIRISEIPHEMLVAHSLSPVPVAFEASVPDSSLLADAMYEDGIAFACCGECMRNEDGFCSRYGVSANDEDANCDHCASDSLYQVFDPVSRDTVLTFFILKDKSLLDSRADLLDRLKKYFPELADVEDAIILPHPASALWN